MLFQPETKKDGYYDVRVSRGEGSATYRVYACSDYAAARMVRRMTGLMPSSERDVSYIAPAARAHFGPDGIAA